MVCFCGLIFVDQDEADIEDLFGPALLARIINGAYGLKGKQALDEAKLVGADTNTERLVKKAEAYFNVLPDTIPVYNHFHPAAWLLENPELLRPTTGMSVRRSTELR